MHSQALESSSPHLRLYQFCKLTLEVLKNCLEKTANEPWKRRSWLGSTPWDQGCHQTQLDAFGARNSNSLSLSIIYLASRRQCIAIEPNTSDNHPELKPQPLSWQRQRQRLLRGVRVLHAHAMPCHHFFMIHPLENGHIPAMMNSPWKIFIYLFWWTNTTGQC